MATIELIIGTTLGGAEYVADELAAQLEAHGHETQTHLTPELSEIAPHHFWLIVSSTHGAGDLPDNIQPFLDEIQAKNPNLNATRYALCAIGDSSYDTFCQGPEKLVEALENCGAKAYVDKIQIDVQYDPVPEDPALAWLTSWQEQLA
ncbi:FMN-binding protein MioC [Shewanella sp. AS1]|uniref:FMN-binding protein MioC n=1 Tax=Shewanella sp. AS1 TaxID=2907626 RepID=UPI001F3E8311|nr:FMN-binding protein MioC [Shewanella sp. AS1]MCE9679651.1 FMN-binding protein MioC [Shewanella sp. AS1]